MEALNFTFFLLTSRSQLNSRFHSFVQWTEQRMLKGDEMKRVKQINKWTVTEDRHKYFIATKPLCVMKLEKCAFLPISFFLSNLHTTHSSSSAQFESEKYSSKKRQTHNYHEVVKKFKWKSFFSAKTKKKKGKKRGVEGGKNILPIAWHRQQWQIYCLLTFD